MSNHVMLEAVQKLIEGYESGDLVHTIDDCPLCQQFFHEPGPSQRKESCAKCPNIVFQVEGQAAAAICIQLFWPLFAIAAILLIPYAWSKHYFKNLESCTCT